VNVEDSKVRSASISLKEWQWKALDSFLPSGDRSDYFQKLVEVDLAKNAEGRYFSRKLGDPSALPKAAEDRLEQRFSRLEKLVASMAEDVAQILKMEKHALGRR
jgi:hypothetical protein